MKKLTLAIAMVVLAAAPIQRPAHALEPATAAAIVIVGLGVIYYGGMTLAIIATGRTSITE